MNSTDTIKENDYEGFSDRQKLNFFFKIDLNPKLKSFCLFEYVDSLETQDISVRARSYGWRAEEMRKFCKRIFNEFKNDIEKTEQFIYIIQPNLASRIFITQKLLTTIKKQYESYTYLDFLAELNSEEISYWAWKIADKKNKAIRALKLLI